MPFKDISTLIVWLVESGGAGFLSYWLLARMEEAGWFKAVKRPWLRVFAFIQAAVIGLAAAYLGGLLRVYAYPETLVDVLNLIIVVGVPAGAIHQIGHGFIELPKKAAQVSEPMPAASD